MPHADAADPASALVTLCAWASRAPPEAVPPDVLRRTALVVADDLACAIAASTDPELATLSAAAWPADPSGAARTEATVLGPCARTTGRAQAALHNAIQANWFQLDEGHRAVMCHAGLYCVPPALAECEATNARLGDLLHAVTIGYEVTCRLAQAWRFAGGPPHPHAVWSAIGCAATLGVLRRYPPHVFAYALSHAGTVAMAGPFGLAASGGLMANLWVGMGVANGFRCADLAHAGVAAPVTAWHAAFQTLLGGSFDPAAMTEQLGTAWAVQGNYHKRLACAGQSQAALEALLDLRRGAAAARAGQADVVIHVCVHPLAAAMSARQPDTSLGARFSLPHLLAVAWIHGRTDAQALGPAFLGDTVVAALRERVTIAADGAQRPAPHDRAAIVQLRFADGTSCRGECRSAEGGPDRPLPAAALDSKISGLAGACHAALFDALRQLDLSARIAACVRF